MKEEGVGGVGESENQSMSVNWRFNAASFNNYTALSTAADVGLSQVDIPTINVKLFLIKIFKSAHVKYKV